MTEAVLSSDLCRRAKVIYVKDALRWDRKGRRFVPKDPTRLEKTKLSKESVESLLESALRDKDSERYLQNEIKREIAGVINNIADELGKLSRFSEPEEGESGESAPEGEEGKVVSYLDANRLVDFAEAVGIICAIRDLPKHQMMKFLGEAKRLKLSKDISYDKILLLKPYLAYATARQHKEMEEL